MNGIKMATGSPITQDLFNRQIEQLKELLEAQKAFLRKVDNMVWDGELGAGRIHYQWGEINDYLGRNIDKLRGVVEILGERGIPSD